MANNSKKVKEELVGQYLQNAWNEKTNKYNISECVKDYDEQSIKGSMAKAFERGFDNCWKILDKAIREWAKKQDMNGSRVQYQIAKEINVDKIKLLK